MIELFIKILYNTLRFFFFLGINTLLSAHMYVCKWKQPLTLS